MFLSKGGHIPHTLCMFDPHCCYVPGATNVDPGMAFDGADLIGLRQKLGAAFYSSFLEQHEVWQGDAGTFFRFPLRSEKQEQYHRGKDKLIARAVSHGTMKKLLKEFQEEAQYCLLFLNNLQRIKISEIRSDGCMHEIYSVEGTMSPIDKQKRDIFITDASRIGSQLHHKEITLADIAPNSTMYDLNIKDSEQIHTRYTIAQSIGFSDSANIPASVLTAYEYGELRLLPRGGIALLREHTKLPALHRDDDLPHVKSKLFCYLPLPIPQC